MSFRPCLVRLVAALAACGGDESAREADQVLDRQLIDAARAGESDTVRSLLGRGASVHARDSTEATALVAAAYGNHVESRSAANRIARASAHSWIGR